MLKKLKSLFIVENKAGASDNQDTAGQEDRIREEDTSQSEVPNNIEIEIPEGNISEQFAEILLKAWQEQNLQGFDYLEYKKSLDSLKDMPMDEATRYQSAFAMAKTMGAEPNALLETARHYVDILKGEEEKFEQALDKQRKLKIEEKEKEANDLNQSIRDKETEIKALQEAIRQDKQSLENVRTDLEASQQKIEQTRQDFVKTYEFLLAQVLSDMEKMKSYLLGKDK